MSIENAFSKDGYIINQGILTEIPYGRYRSDYNGCGWISAYNFLRACQRELPYEQVHRELNEKIWLGGRIGTNPFRLYRYLKAKGVIMKRVFTTKSLIRDTSRCKAGILMYWTGKGAHFVTFEKNNESGQIFRFFNAVYGKEFHYSTISEFEEQFCKFWLLFAVVYPA